MRVLVVEDEAEFANLIAEGLRDQGMAVDVAYDGLAGASRLNLNPYDVVVLDRDLPGLHGDTLCRMITDSHDPAMILMLTAAGSPAERVAGLALGADDYLPKPFHFPELVLRIRALARRKPAAQDRTLTAAGIELDPLARTATRDGNSSTSPPKSSPSSKRCSGSAPARSAPNDCSSRPGTRTPTHSPTRYASRSAACAASSENPDHPEHTRHRISHHRDRQPDLVVRPRTSVGHSAHIRARIGRPAFGR